MNRSVPKKVDEALSAPTDSQRTLYAVEFTSSKFVDLRKLSLNQDLGLVYCQMVVSTTNTWRLLTYWNDQPAYTANVAHFKQLLAEHGTVIDCRWEGHHQSTRMLLPRRSVLAWIGIVIAVATAAWGWFKTFQDIYATFLVTPNAKLTLASSTRRSLSHTGEINALKGEAFELEFDLRNQNTSGTCSVYVDPAEVNPISVADGIGELEFGQSVVPVVAPGEAKSILLRGKALRSGQFQIEVSGSCESGMLWPRQRIQPVAIKLRVWEPWAKSKPTVKSEGNQAEVKFIIDVGKAFEKGLNITAGLTDSRDVTFARASFNDSGTHSERGLQQGTGDARSIMIRLRTGAVGPMQQHSYWLVLKSNTSLTEPQWIDIANSLQINIGPVVN